MAELLAVGLLAHQRGARGDQLGGLVADKAGPLGQVQGGSAATRMSMCTLFLAVFPSGTRRKPIAGPTPSGSMIEAPSGSS